MSDNERIITNLRGLLDACEKQLAAERARCYNDGWVEGRKSMEKQLTAEKEKHENWKKCAKAQEKDIQRLKEQLADAQKQIEMDTECIERIRNHGMRLELILEKCEPFAEAWAAEDLTDEIRDALRKSFLDNPDDLKDDIGPRPGGKELTK